MTRVLLLTVLGLGAVFGFASGVRHLRHAEYGWGPPWMEGSRMYSSRMDAMAEACVRAARSATPNAPTPAATPAATPAPPP
jgi:hypothetical protein